VPTSQRVPGAAALTVEDVLGGADVVGLATHFEAAFRVRDDQPVGVLVAELDDVRRLEHLVHRTVALPEQDLRLADLLAREAAVFQVGVPHHHLVERNAHLEAGPAAEVLVGEEQHLLALGEGPVEDGRGVGEVHTMPPCSPQKALRSAAELM
jgi:hypothetical protein